MRRLLAALICLLLVTPAYAQKTKTQLNTEVTTNLPDNTVGAITPADVRTTLLDMIASWVDLNGTSGFNCAVNQWVNAFSNLSTPSCSQPTFANISGNIAVSQMASGTGASVATYWRGDGTWATPAGSGTVTEQKNTAGTGLTTSGNCDNTSSNAGSPCQYNLTFVPFNYLGGLTLSSVSGTVLGSAAGQAADSTNTVMMSIGAFTKSTAGAWAVGSGANGMGNGLTIAVSTWYHVCLANNNGVPDIWFDTAAACTNRPAGISDTKFRRIGSFRTNAAAQILAFIQNGDDFTWVVQQANVVNTAIPGSPTLTVVTVPSGIVAKALLYAQINDAITAAQVTILTPGVSVCGGGCSVGSVYANANLVGLAQLVVQTNTSSQVNVIGTFVGGAGTTYYVTTIGYTDFRGQQ